MREIIDITPAFRRRDDHVELDLFDTDALGKQVIRLRLAFPRDIWAKALSAANELQAAMRQQDADAARKVSALARGDARTVL